MNNLDLLSNETAEILKNKKGYRYEALYGEGYRDVKEVCMHEVFELENTDIPTTLLNLYRELLNDDEIALLERVEEREYADNDEELFGDICESIACKISGSNKCIWLCNSTKSVIDAYVFNPEEVESLTDENFDEYDIAGDVCILSDCSYDGALLAFNF